MRPKDKPSGFNAWGGDTAINRYLDWVGSEMKTHYAINLKIVRLADAADAVKLFRPKLLPDVKRAVRWIYSG